VEFFIFTGRFDTLDQFLDGSESGTTAATHRPISSLGLSSLTKRDAGPMDDQKRNASRNSIFWRLPIVTFINRRPAPEEASPEMTVEN
jgi:hypothetical protein